MKDYYLARIAYGAYYKLVDSLFPLNEDGLAHTMERFDDLEQFKKDAWWEVANAVHHKA